MKKLDENRGDPPSPHSQKGWPTALKDLVVRWAWLLLFMSFMIVLVFFLRNLAQ